MVEGVSGMARLTPALVRGLDILELFLDARTDDGLSAPEVTAATGLPRATVHELLATLVAKSYLRKDPVSGRFHLGLRVFQLGNAYGERLDLVTVGRRIAEEIAADCDETVNVGVLEGSDVVYMAKVESRHAVRMVSAVGRRIPASCTAMGKAMLAHLPDADLDALYPAERALPSLTARSIVDRRELLDQLAEARRTGLALEVGESTEDVSCAAAPVRDHRGEVVASVSVSVPDSRWSQRPVAEWADFARRGAERLSATLGAR